MKLFWLIALVCVCFSLRAATYYVATNGSDVASGSLGAPWASVGHALAAASYGDTIYLRGGTFRENIVIPSMSGIGSLTNMLHILAYTNEVPIISGTTNISGPWTLVNSPLIYTAKYGSISTSNTIVDDVIAGTATGQVWSASYSGRPQEAFYVTSSNRISFQQLGWSGTNYDWVWSGSPGSWNNTDIRPQTILTNWQDWSFWWCNTNSTLYVRCAVGYAPTNSDATIEVSATKPFYTGLNYVDMNGITVIGSQSSDQNTQFSMANVGSNCVVANCSFLYGDLTGLSVYRGCIVTNCVIANNGMVGANDAGPNGFYNNQVISNNFRLLPNYFGSAGIKIVNGSLDIGGTVVSGNKFLHNNGYGLWFDTCQSNSVNVDVVGNIFANNNGFAGGGLFMESSGNTSSNFRVFNNVFQTNTFADILLRGAQGVLVQFNTIESFGGFGFAMQCYNSSGDRPSANNAFQNNIIVQNDPSQAMLALQVGYTTGGNFYDFRTNNVANNNCYYPAAPFASFYAVEEIDDPSIAGSINFYSFGGFTNAVAPFDSLSFVQNPQLANLTPTTTSPVLNKGRPLFAVPTDFYGASRSIVPTLGAVEGNQSPQPIFIAR